MRFRFRVAAVLLGAALALGLAEIAVRIWLPHVRESALPGSLLTINDDLGWSLRPSTRAQHRSRYFQVEYHINVMGFRDAARTARPVKRPYRILLYGDSLVFGWGVPASSRFSNLLEAESPGLEMWNHAVPGYGLDQEILLYQKESQAFDVDEVMFFVSVNTLDRIHSGYIYAKYKPRFVADAEGSLRLVRVPHLKNAAVSLTYRLLSPFYLPYFLQVHAARAQHAIRSGDRSTTTSDEPISRRFIGRLELALLRRAVAAATAAHHRISVLAANLSNQDRQALGTFCHENGIAYLQIGSALTVEADTDESSGIILGKEDKHWNVRANRMIVDSLRQQMSIADRRVDH